MTDMDAKESETGLSRKEIANKVLKGEFSLFDRQSKAKIWRIFSHIMDQDNVMLSDCLYCKTCSSVIKYNKLSTSNIVRHKCYVLKYHSNQDTKSEAEKSNIQFGEHFDNNLGKLLMIWITKEFKSYHLVNNKSMLAVFRELASLGSRFGFDIDIERLLPSVAAVAKNISETYEECLEKVKKDIASIKDNGFGVTSKVMTSNFSKQNYIALTIHYLKNGTLNFRLLGLRTLEEINTNQNIAETVREILDDFDCELRSTSIIVTDGNLDIIKAFHSSQSLKCITQLLNNVLDKSVEIVPEATEIVSACFKLVGFLKKKGFNYVLDESLKGPCHTRWETIYKMLYSVENNWSDINKFLTAINESTAVLDINIKHFSAIAKILQPFEEAIKALEEESCATLHLVVVYLHELKKSCDINEGKLKNFVFLESLKRNIYLNLEKLYSENITTLHKLALFLYPPTNKLLQFSDKEKICIEEECKRLMSIAAHDSKHNLNPIVKHEPDAPPSPLSKRKKLFSDFVEPETNRDLNVLIAEEMQYYKHARVANSANFDVFNWWEIQKDSCPLLYKLSRIVLATPASCAVSQRIFSTANSLLCDNFNRNSKEMQIERIMFINTNSDCDEIDN